MSARVHPEGSERPPECRVGFDPEGRRVFCFLDLVFFFLLRGIFASPNNRLTKRSKIREQSDERKRVAFNEPDIVVQSLRRNRGERTLEASGVSGIPLKIENLKNSDEQGVWKHVLLQGKKSNAT